MKQTLLLAAAFLTLIPLTLAHPNHGQLQEPSTLPGSATYGLDRAMESVSLALTFGKANKAEKRLNIAEERLAEANELTRKNRSQKAVKAVTAYTIQMQKVGKIQGNLPQSKSRKLQEHLNSSRNVHQAVLKSVMDKVPQQAMKGIRTALKKSQVPVKTPAKTGPSQKGTGKQSGKDTSQTSDRSTDAYTASGKAIQAK